MITKKWITPETLSLVQEKRILKKKRDSSELADREYRQKCNKVRKAARADNAKWLERQCENTEKYYQKYRTTEVYKMIGDINRKWQPKQKAIRDSNGKLLVNTTDIIQRWTTYCSKLYMVQPDQKVSNDLVKKLKDISPPLADSKGDILVKK